MFRDEKCTVAIFVDKFIQLKKKLDDKEEIRLDSEYHHQLKEYIGRLYAQVIHQEAFGEIDFNNIREAEMSNLNRLQKLKNKATYKKDKHKLKQKNEDWG